MTSSSHPYELGTDETEKKKEKARSTTVLKYNSIIIQTRKD